MSDGGQSAEPVAARSSVDVVIVTRNTRALTLRCARSVLAAAERGEAAIACTVVDNGSSDGTLEALAAETPAVRVLRNERNVGYGAACNQGLWGGAGEIVLILNSDVYARAGAIGRLAGFLTANPGHVGATGRLVDPGSERVQVGHNLRRFPRLVPQAAQMLGLERHWPSNPASRGYLGLDLDYGRTQDVEQPAGSCLACRRSAFEALGGFDEGFFYWYEDVDLARRLHELGRIVYVHDATFEHVGGATFAQWDRPESILSWYPGLFRYFERHRPRREQLALRALAAALGVVRAAFSVAADRERARAFLRVAALATRPRSRPAPDGRRS